MRKSLKVESKSGPKNKRPSHSNPVREMNFSSDTPMSQLVQLQETIGNRATHQLLMSGILQFRRGSGLAPDQFFLQREAESIELPQSQAQRTKEDENFQRQANDNIKIQAIEKRIAQAKEKHAEIQIQTQGQTEKVLQMQNEEVQTSLSFNKVQFGMNASKGSYGSPEVFNAIREQRGQGEPLEPKLRFTLERSMGTDFKSVRVHRDATAAQLNSMLSARAFTNRDDIYFNQSQYNPYSPGGQQLIAHELAHVVQQLNIPDLQFQLQDPVKRNQYEQEANQMASQAVDADRNMFPEHSFKQKGTADNQFGTVQLGGNTINQAGKESQTIGMNGKNDRNITNVLIF